MAMDQILKVIFQGDSRGLSSSLRNVQGELKNFGATATRTFGSVQTAFAALGVTLSAGALATGFKRIIDSMDALNDASKRLGVSTESLSALGYAAEQSGASIEDLQTGLKFLNRSLVEAQQGNKELAVILRRFGITALDDTETALMKLADGFAAMPDGAQKTATALKVLGRSGTTLIPLLNEGSAGLAKFRQEAERLGIVVSGEAAKAADDFNDSLNRLGNEARGLGIALAGPIIQSLQDLIIQFNAGREAAGGFWGALFKFGLKENDPGRQINRLLEARKKLEENPPTPQLFTSMDKLVEQRRKDIEEINRELEYWRTLQRRENESLYADQYSAADRANKKTLASTEDRVEKEVVAVNKLKTAYESLSESIKKGAADATAGAGKPVEQSSVLDINTLRDKAKTLLESGNAADTKAALAALQKAQKINDNLLATGQITKQYYLTQAELILKLAEAGERVAGTEVGIEVGIDAEASQAAAQQYLELSRAFWAQNPAYQPVIPVIQQGITAATDDRVTISAASITGKAAGGLINGPGTGLSDSILARLSAGEFVVRARAVKNYGLGFLERLNSMSLPRFASGGPVGTPVNIYLPGGESFGVSAAPSVAKAMSRVLGLEVLKRGRR